MSDAAFENLEFVYLGACEAGAGGSGVNNLVNAFYSKGVETVLGFKEQVNTYETNLWTQAFMTALSEGMTINDAMEVADQAVYEDSSIDKNNLTTDEIHRYLVGSGELIPCN